MKMRITISALACLAILLGPVPASFAHHSFAAVFDLDKPLTVTGSVTKLEWVNPHCYVELDVKDSGGAIQHWSFEFGAPVALKKAGMRQDLLPVGQMVTITGYGAKKTENLGWVSKFTFPDGRVIRITPEVGAPAN